MVTNGLVLIATRTARDQTEALPTPFSRPLPKHLPHPAGVKSHHFISHRGQKTKIYRYLSTAHHSFQYPDMPVPKIFKRFASKSTLKVTKDVSAVLDVSADDEKDASSKTLVMAATVPAYSDNLKEAWDAANKELPKAKGVEKFLNQVGGSIVLAVPACAPPC